MRSHARISLLALVACATVAASAPAAAQAALGIEKAFAGNCKIECTESTSSTELYTQAAGHPPFGITEFTVNTSAPGGPPTGLVNHIRTDVAPGVSTNPQATASKCTFEEFGKEAVAPGSGLFEESHCKAETLIGENKIVIYAGSQIPLSGPVYNLVQPTGLASDFGVVIALPTAITEAKLNAIFHGSQPTIEKAQYYAHSLIEGTVEWASDYHDVFEINVSSELPLVSSRLIFKGTAGKGNFITNPSACTVPGLATTTTLTLKSAEGATVVATPHSVLGTNNCASVPFEPAFSLAPETTQSDEADGLTATLALKQNESAATDTSYLKSATVTLPEGMTLNPAAAYGLEACSPAQIALHVRPATSSCPAGSKIGTVTLKVPGLPANEPLEGNIYLGGPETGPITGPPYTMYIDAESARYGVKVRLKGEVVPNEATGQLTATFAENPEQPFSEMILHFTGGPLAPIANPLTCAAATTQVSLSPFSGTPATVAPSVAPFTVNSNGGACLSPLPFKPTQSTGELSPNAGAKTSLTLNFERKGGEQYLSTISTKLAPGLLGLIPTVKLCEEPQAAAGTCASTSQIGVATIKAGAGTAPFTFSGPVFLTGPYGGAPYGLSVAVPAVAGPFSLGTVVTRATISVNPYTAQVTVASTLPTIVKGVPLRIRSLSISINKQGYLINPTNCGVFATESSLTGFTPGVAGTAASTITTGFSVANCNALAFKPTFTAASEAKTSKANGASLETTINQPAGQANMKSVLVQLPRQLPSRLSTLQKACLQATFEVNPYDCPTASRVGGARANTPALPGKLQGPAYLVSHGGAAFPDLDLVMEADGVRVIVVGNTDIKHSITTTNFAANPDVPISSITVNLPIGPHSALAANGNLCANPLIEPTTITAQNGKVIKQNTKINVRGCPVMIVGRKVVGNSVILTIKTFAAGRISGSGSSLGTVYRHLGSAQNTATLRVPLSSGGLNRGRPFQTRVRVGFVPKHKGPSSTAYATVTFG
jgi:hypothetical protein